MGLAASQSRFLAITARKANCEYQSMNYAQQKLSITRQMAKATADYQNSLNATKLVWDASGSETAITDLSYDMMMTPSPLNGYDPYLVTKPSGQIVLSEKYAKAAEAAGITGEYKKGGFPNTQANRDAFVRALADQGIISGSLADTIVANEYISNAGCGAEPIDKTSSNAMTLGSFAQFLNKAKNDNKDLLYGLNIAETMSSINTNYIYSTRRDEDKVDTYTIAKNGSIINQNQTNITIGDLLTDDYILTRTFGDSNDPANYKDMAGIIEVLITKIAEQLGHGADSFTGLYTDDQSGRALQEALALTLERYNGDSNSVIDAGRRSSRSKQYSDAVNKANSSNAITRSGTSRDNGSEKVSVSLSNLLSTFLTYYAQSLEGYQCGYVVKDSYKDSVMVTDDPSYYYVIHNEGSIASEKDLLITDFYNIMFNNICSNGWTTVSGANIEDKEYLSHALKNGQLFVSSLNTDGYYYQGAYTENGYIQEVTDDDAIAQAEAEYNKVKNTLSYKEERIELDMQNLDLEISALTTELDTVKQLISKSVEKTFTMFGS